MPGPGNDRMQRFPRAYHRRLQRIGHVTLVTITETTILVPYHLFRLLPQASLTPSNCP